ncbi:MULTISPECIES: PLP-dependent aminotransferase family protein [Agrobacterium]|uniref:DNA-binding transcriptional MocR family regulator n=1 Tax=Agrobacterium tumefaciens TaxID=358 RepID=A0AAW8M2D8_AGRTU|nr:MULTISPECIES: PLP-dependent aminotransferase family protein [Agrobacterium]MBP2511555.1 DNA-binding transcriptional MocR family regulator [Agrobacterium tumefaciens]MBP2520731.1 DNA-binding transcriptional MocR family regulator [Agrobacterium tumefaciens]MBP2537555.1 DNA-binding transcriptional MocR family regulator [Agrobacterium tumefaciens]MBP2542791.1 DNA-binding transcriptional MocR family regulator [Agrobacterium tumefaciens]MBP2568849.1 DNA-binding transcriptional MocR family regulat
MVSSLQQYDRVVSYLKTQIGEGVVEGNHRLPTQRSISKTLGLSLPTVARGFAEAKRLGIIETAVGRGSFAKRPLDPAKAVRIDLSLNAPSAAVIRRVLAQDLESFASEKGLEQLASYSSPSDQADVVGKITNWLQEMDVKVQADDMILCEGAQNGLFLALQSICRAGDAVICEDVTYPGLFAVARSLNLVLVPIATSAAGPDLEEFGRAASRADVKAAFLMPSLQNPLGYTLDAETRLKVVQIAKDSNVTIIEDDVYRGLLTSPLEPLFNFAPFDTIYIGSLSKVLAPGLRLGYVCAKGPRRDSLASLAAAQRYSISPISLSLTARWFKRDLHKETCTAHRIEIERLAHAYQAVFGAAPNTKAYHLWVPLQNQEEATAAMFALAAEGIEVPSTQTFSAGFSPSCWGVRLAVGALSADLEVFTRIKKALSSSAARWDFTV